MTSDEMVAMAASEPDRTEPGPAEPGDDELRDGAWVGPAVHRELKLPRLRQLVNSFDAEGRRVILHSTLADRSADVAPTSDPDIHEVRVASVGVAVAIAADTERDTMVGDRDLRGWTRTAPSVWRWGRAARTDLTLQTLPGPEGGVLVAHLGAHLTDGDRELVRGIVARGIGAGPDVDRRSTSAVERPRPEPAIGNVADALSRLNRRPLLAVTGAGISSASGVLPIFGPDGLDDRLGLFEPFPGRLFESMLTTPDVVLGRLIRWHLAFLAAAPTSAHRAFVDLERRGHLAGVLTSNMDRLHHAAGARRVAETEQLSKARPPAEAGVIVVGSANDQGGVLERARASDAVLVIVDQRVPDWAREEDLVLIGDPQRIVPELAAGITGLRTPLTVVDHRGAAADGIAPHRSGLDAWVPRPSPHRPGPPWSELASLADLVQHRSPARPAAVHGPRHRLSVAWIGAHLAATDPEVDPLIVALFALFHDCRLQDDGHDPEHGGHGAGEVQAMLDGVDWIEPARRDRVAEACRWYTHDRTSGDHTIDACWDADRLALWRPGAPPPDQLLSRPESEEVIRWSRHLVDVGDHDVAWDDWNPVALACAAVDASR